MTEILETFRKNLESGTTALGISVDEEKLSRLFCYYQMLTEKNKVMNLTAITEESEFVQKHIIDSLAIVKAGDAVREILEAGDIDLIDVGTGPDFRGSS